MCSSRRACVYIRTGCATESNLIAARPARARFHYYNATRTRVAHRGMYIYLTWNAYPPRLPVRCVGLA